MIKPRKPVWSVLLGLYLMAGAPASVLADSSALILSSVPGDPERAERFNKWTDGVKTALIEKFGFSAERVVVLSDKQATRASVQKSFAALKDQLKPLDTFFLFFIGHGSYDPDAG